LLSGVPEKQPESLRGQKILGEFLLKLGVISKLTFTIHEPSYWQTFRFEIEGLPIE